MGRADACYPRAVTLSVAIITYNEEKNIGRTLESVRWADEIIIVDSGSTDRTLEIARSYGEKVKLFSEPWKGFPAQKNSAIAKATGDWVLSLDADEPIEPALAEEIGALLAQGPDKDGYEIPRKNFLFGRWIRYGGWYPDPKLRLFRRGKGRFEDRRVHESMRVDGSIGRLQHAILHYAYDDLAGYIEHNNRYSTLGAELAVERGRRGFSFAHIVLNPLLTFLKNYIFRLGFLDGKQGFLVHFYHSVYVSWKYVKVWEMTREKPR